jgi:hypothetical protein
MLDIIRSVQYMAQTYGAGIDGPQDHRAARDNPGLDLHVWLSEL